MLGGLKIPRSPPQIQSNLGILKTLHSMSVALPKKPGTDAVAATRRWPTRPVPGRGWVGFSAYISICIYIYIHIYIWSSTLIQDKPSKRTGSKAEANPMH